MGLHLHISFGENSQSTAPGWYVHGAFLKEMQNLHLAILLAGNCQSATIRTDNGLSLWLQS